MKVVTQKLPGPSHGVVRYVHNPTHQFDATSFDTDALARGALIDGEATAGRGNTVFFTLHKQQLVLRHYRRGGLVRHISEKHYIFTGMDNTRAMREFDLLLSLQSKGLPAPVPYACRVLRHGLFYTASLVTHRLPGQTLAERLLANGLLSSENTCDKNLWRSLGELIARFHAAGVFHADLNAHNIMLDDDGNLFLIDFDRGRMQALPKDPAQSGWCVENISRLERSIKKIISSESNNGVGAHTLMQKFSQLKEQWAKTLSSLTRV